MATNYPGSKQTFSDPAGTNTLSSPDHAGLHTDINDTVEAIQDTVGTTAGTSILKNFTAGQFAPRVNGSNVFQHTFSGTLTSGVVNNSIIGTPAITGGTIASGVINNSTIGTPMVTGGTINSAVLGTPTFSHFQSGGTSAHIVANNALAPTVVTLTDSAGGTVAINAAAGQVGMLTLGTTAGNRTIGAPTNAISGAPLTIGIKQNAAATGTLIFASNYRMSSDIGTPSLGTASTWNYYAWRYHAADGKWDFQGQSKNVI